MHEDESYTKKLYQKTYQFNCDFNLPEGLSVLQYSTFKKGINKLGTSFSVEI